MAILIYGSGGGEGASVADTTAVQSDVLPGKYFYLADGTRVEGSMATKAVATIVPSTSDQTINANQYLLGAQTIQGSANLTAANIKSGVNIFGITGSFYPENLGQVFFRQYPASNGRITITSTVDATINMMKIKGILVCCFPDRQLDTGDIIYCLSRKSTSGFAVNDIFYGAYRDNNSNAEVSYGDVAKIYSISSNSLSIAPLNGFYFASGELHDIYPFYVE